MDFQDQQRRQTLEAFQAANSEHQIATGQTETKQILLARFPNVQAWRPLRTELAQEKIPVEVTRNGREVAVFIRVSDRDRAFEILRRANVKGQRRERGFHRDYELTFGLLAAGSVVTWLVYYSTGNIFAASTSILTVLVTGLTLDRCRVNLRCTGYLYVTMTELFVFVTMVAGLMAMWQYARMTL